LDSLLAKEAADQWSPDHDIDWNLPVKYPLWFRRRTYLKVISQFYHGECATQEVCRRLLGLIDDPAAQAFLSYQLSDEEKHAAVFARYIQRLGDIAPMESAMEKALDGSLTWQGSKYGQPIGLLVSFHIVFESGALLLLDNLVRRFPCPLFRSIIAKVVKDEARHIAFGLKYVQAHIAKVSKEERCAIYVHVAKLWGECARSAESRYTLPVALATRIGSNWLAQNWLRQKKQLIRIGLVTEDDINRIEEALP
jgi:hypothetical protein